MKKRVKITIESCRVCPLSGYTIALVGTDIWGVCKETGKNIDDPNIIQEWCPLEDEDEELV